MDYVEYLEAVKEAMDSAIEECGFNPAQAFNFAHTELEGRMAKFPDETALALVALALCGIERKSLPALLVDDRFIADVDTTLADDRPALAAQRLVPDQRSRLLRDAERVKGFLKLRS